MSFPHAPTYPTFVPAADDHGTRFRPSAGFADDLNDVSRSVARAADLDAVGTDDDARCSCCGAAAPAVLIVGTTLALCDHCLEQSAFDPAGAERVRAYLAAERSTSLPCPKCGYQRHSRSVEALVDHLRTAHRLDDAFAATVIVNAVEVATDGEDVPVDEPASRLVGDADLCVSCGHDVGHRGRCINPECESKRDPDADR